MTINTLFAIYIYIYIAINNLVLSTEKSRKLKATKRKATHATQFPWQQSPTPASPKHKRRFGLRSRKSPGKQALANASVVTTMDVVLDTGHG